MTAKTEALFYRIFQTLPHSSILSSTNYLLRSSSVLNQNLFQSSLKSQSQARKTCLLHLPRNSQRKRNLKSLRRKQERRAHLKFSLTIPRVSSLSRRWEANQAMKWQISSLLEVWSNSSMTPPQPRSTKSSKACAATSREYPLAYVEWTS